MKVILDKGAVNEKLAVLKLYDRRYCPDVRDINGHPQWTKTSDQQYHDFITHGDGPFYISSLSDDDYDEAAESRTVAEAEAWIYRKCRSMYETELEIYQALAELQGICVPKLYQEVLFEYATFPSSVAKYFEVPGLIIELIDGFRLADWDTNVPQHLWQDLCLQALDVVRRIGDCGILNRDAQLKNMMVREQTFCSGNPVVRFESTEGACYEVFAIDFALCRRRRPNETDDEWKAVKFDLDEEENVAGAMEGIAITQHGMKLEWQQTRQYDGPWVFGSFTDGYTYEEFVLREW